MDPTDIPDVYYIVLVNGGYFVSFESMSIERIPGYYYTRDARLAYRFETKEDAESVRKMYNGHIFEIKKDDV